MKRQLMDILACPVCKHHPLGLEVVSENDEGIVEGKLCCPRCGTCFPIDEGIPDLIPPGK
ncbi:MAG: methytransferase partner Trm112 [Methanomassiliicoccus sp.]|nr:methytransferase partner Trm112 [Methanomassiliicoccus sp.]